MIISKGDILKKTSNRDGPSRFFVRNFTPMMKEERIVGLLEKVLGKSTSARGGEEAVFYCPKCNHHKKKLTLNKSTQQFQCWVCNFKGNRVSQILKVKGAPDSVHRELVEINKEYNFKPQIHHNTELPEVTLPEGFTPLIQGSGIIRDKAWAYLQSRGITAYDIIKYNIGYVGDGPLTEMVIIPSYDGDGKLNYWVARSFNKNSFIKHKLAPTSKNIIGFEMFINFSLPIIICEGAFDAISIKRNAIPIFGKKISKALYSRLIKSEVKQIYLILDKDALNESLTYAKELMAYNKEVFLIELEGKDPNNMGFIDITKLLHKAQPLTPVKLLEKRILS